MKIRTPDVERIQDVGELIGQAVVEILLGKGIGKAGSILEKTKHGAELLEKAKLLKSATVAKIAEGFSDEAASAAANRIKQALRNPALYSGFAGAEFLADLTRFAGNKLKNGAMSFKQFVAEASKEFGDGIKGKVDELATSYRKAMQGLGFGSEIIELDIEQTSKLAKTQFQRETTAARQKLLAGIQEAENSSNLQKMKINSPDDYDWLQENPRHKELSFDPANKQFKVKEAKAALEAEKQGLLEAPVKRGISPGGNEVGDDFVDGFGIVWDMKEAQGGSRTILKALNDGENVLVDARSISDAEFKTLEAEVEANRPQNNKKVKYLR